eukprot:6464112-Amphidinium_carterae.1
MPAAPPGGHPPAKKPETNLNPVPLAMQRTPIVIDEPQRPDPDKATAPVREPLFKQFAKDIPREGVSRKVWRQRVMERMKQNKKETQKAGPPKGAGKGKTKDKRRERSRERGGPKPV